MRGAYSKSVFVQVHILVFYRITCHKFISQNIYNTIAKIQMRKLQGLRLSSPLIHYFDLLIGPGSAK